jgi:hypothetical protein
MNYGCEQMQVEFHQRANAMFMSVYNGFETAVSNVSRRNQEFRFQQMKKQYAVTMEQELVAIAKDVLMRYKGEKQVHEIDLTFHQFIKDYLHRFIQKVNDL